jgi:superfamily II DNA or RNA helicase
VTIHRDPRRLFTAAQRATIAARQHHRCAECQHDLPDVFHCHHVIPWNDGGPTEVDNGAAVCPDCHAHAAVRQLFDFQPRRWQAEAIEATLPNLRAGLFGTVAVVPGAGKTLFGTWVYRQLRDTGDVARVVVFVPNSNLRKQWASEARPLNVFLRADSSAEHDREDGVVVTYHVLSNPAALAQITADAADTPTLFILDEVHHLAKDVGGSAGAWAHAINRLVGDHRHPLHRVLNLSGTLFRSNPNERICTIQYEATAEGKLETLADYVETAKALQDEKQLRRLKILGLDADMEIAAVDLGALADRDTIRAIDIDDNTKLRSDVLYGLVRGPRFITGVIDEIVARLAYASNYLQGAPVKALIVADGREHARQVHAALVDTVGPALAFLATGEDDRAAEDAIDAFRASTGQGVMVAVQKVTEGFDVPDICVLGYLRTWKAPLFINQMCGRAMRVTDREREPGFDLLPAVIIIPNETQIKDAFANVLQGMQALDADPCPRCGELVCDCPPVRRPRPEDPRDKICQICGFPWMLCICECDQCGLSRFTGCRCTRNRNGVQVDVVNDPTLDSVRVQDEDNERFEDVDLGLIETLRGAYGANLPEVLREEFTHATQTAMTADPMRFLEILRTLGGER